MIYSLFHVLFSIMVPTSAHLMAFSLRLLPLAPSKDGGEAERAHRMEIADACVEATADRTERYICMKIARFESNYRADVGRCAIRGSVGEVTAWQILPRNSTEKERLCKSIGEDARLAMERVRESRAACSALPKAEQLALYARGSCNSAEGRRLSKVRWPYDQEVRGLE